MNLTQKLGMLTISGLIGTGIIGCAGTRANGSAESIKRGIVLDEAFIENPFSPALIKYMVLVKLKNGAVVKAGPYTGNEAIDLDLRYRKGDTIYLMKDADKWVIIEKGFRN